MSILGLYEIEDDTEDEGGVMAELESQDEVFERALTRTKREDTDFPEYGMSAEERRAYNLGWQDGREHGRAEVKLRLLGCEHEPTCDSVHDCIMTRERQR